MLHDYYYRVYTTDGTLIDGSGKANNLKEAWQNAVMKVSSEFSINYIVWDSLKVWNVDDNNAAEIR